MTRVMTFLTGLAVSVVCYTIYFAVLIGIPIGIFHLLVVN